jgi:hypothetical protein
MLRRVALVRTDVSEELRAFFIRVTRISELGTTLAVTNEEIPWYFFAACVGLDHSSYTSLCSFLHAPVNSSPFSPNILSTACSRTGRSRPLPVTFDCQFEVMLPVVRDGIQFLHAISLLLCVRCMCVCMYVYMYAFMYVCMYICMCASMFFLFFIEILGNPELYYN